jgi:hypothetical protein
MTARYKINLVKVASTLVLCIAAAGAPAYASDWMIVGVEPDAAPHRSMYVMQSGSAWISRRLANDADKKVSATSKYSNASSPMQTIYTGTVLQVFENAGGTNFINYEVEFMCTEGMARIAQATAYDRKGTQEKGGSADWMKVQDNWIGKAEMIACSWKNWLAAEEAYKRGASLDTQKTKNKKPAQTASFESLGIQYLGDIAGWTDVVDAVWNNHWTDATQPAYYVGTPEEQTKARQASLAILEQARGLATEQEKWSKIYFDLEKKIERLSDKFAQDMAGVGGITEAQVMARWGAPQSVAEASGVRHLTYNFSDTLYGVNTVAVDLINTNGAVVGQTTQNQLTSTNRNCRRMLSLKEGGAVERAYRVFDFSIGCD